MATLLIWPLYYCGHFILVQSRTQSVIFTAPRYVSQILVSADDWIIQDSTSLIVKQTITVQESWHKFQWNRLML